MHVCLTGELEVIVLLLTTSYISLIISYIKVASLSDSSSVNHVLY